MDNAGFCRFHRQWAEEMLPEIIGSVFGVKEGFVERVKSTAGRINSRNAAVFWESERNTDLVISFLKRRRDVENDKSPELLRWIDLFQKDRKEATLEFWFETRKGIDESLREF